MTVSFKLLETCFWGLLHTFTLFIKYMQDSNDTKTLIHMLLRIPCFSVLWVKRYIHDHIHILSSIQP